MYYCFTTHSRVRLVFVLWCVLEVDVESTAAVLLLYCCFTAALLLLYYCFTESTVALLSRLLLYHCFTTSLFPVLGLAAFMPLHLWPIFTQLIYSYDNWCATNAGAHTSCLSSSLRLQTLVA